MSRMSIVIFSFIMAAGVHQAEALYIPFSGTVDTATALLSSGIGDYRPVFASTDFTGAIGTDSAGNYYALLQLPSFSSDGPNCSMPSNGCSVFTSDGSYLVTDDVGPPQSSHAFTQTGNIVRFSVANGPTGDIAGTFDLGTFAGTIDVDLYAGSAYRADNPADLTATLTVVPLPGSAPLFASAVLALGLTAAARRREADVQVGAAVG